jgi:hypothetical protein
MPDKPSIVVDAGSYALTEKSIAGAGLRLVEIAQALSHRYAVRVISGSGADTVPLCEAEVVSPSSAERAIPAADAVMFFDTPDRDRIELAVAHRRLIIGECRVPIEHMDFPSLLAQPDPTGEYQRYLSTFQRQMEVTHHFLCRSPAERSVLLSVLCASGRVRPADIGRSRTLAHLASTVPVGFSEESLRAADAVQPLPMADFLWTGGMWAFYEPLVLVEAVHQLRERGVDTSAAFMHAAPVADTRATIERVTERIAELGLADRVLLHSEPLALPDRDRYLKAATGYVCITKRGLENETATRLRVRDTVLYGKPLIVDPHGNTARLVERDNLGIVLRTPDAKGLADAMECVKTGEAAAPGRRLDHLYERSLAGFMDWLDSELRVG